MIQGKHKAVPDAYLCNFALGNVPQPSRSRYDSQRRSEVHIIRKSGACLRCRLLKKSCSSGNPCTACIKAASKRSASRALSWMECIRPSLINISIYGSNKMWKGDHELGGSPVLQYLANGDVSWKFDIPFQWNIDELSTFVAGWLVADEDAPRTSMVGIMSSASLLSVISGLIDPEICLAFKALNYRSSLIFNAASEHPATYSTDAKVLHYCGQMLLSYLDSTTRPHALAQLGKHELYALFLIILGCIISTKYVSETLGDLSEPSVDLNTLGTKEVSLPDLARARELVRLLAHQMVYIGQSTGLLSESLDSKLIQLLVTSTWRKKAAFNWVENTTSSDVASPLTAGKSIPPVLQNEAWNPTVQWDRAAEARYACSFVSRRKVHSTCATFASRHLFAVSPEHSRDFESSRAKCYINTPEVAQSPVCRISDLAQSCTQMLSQFHHSQKHTQSIPIDQIHSCSVLQPILASPGSPQAFCEKQQLDLPIHMVEEEPPNFPLDITIATPDSGLPTFGLEFAVETEGPDAWPCLNRMPTPVPEENEQDFDFTFLLSKNLPYTISTTRSCLNEGRSNGFNPKNENERYQRQLLI